MSPGPKVKYNLEKHITKNCELPNTLKFQGTSSNAFWRHKVRIYGNIIVAQYMVYGIMVIGTNIIW